MSASSKPSVPSPFSPWPKDAEIVTHTGGCHCRKLTYEFEHPALTVCQPVSCNCSICSKTGELFLYADQDRFRFTAGSFADATTYLCLSKQVPRYFCPICGVNVLWNAFGKVGVNARTIDGIEIDKVELAHVDGKSLVL